MSMTNRTENSWAGVAHLPTHIIPTTTIHSANKYTHREHIIGEHDTRYTIGFSPCEHSVCLFTCTPQRCTNICRMPPGYTSNANVALCEREIAHTMVANSNRISNDNLEVYMSRRTSYTRIYL